jgi:hypothetical protein
MHAKVSRHPADGPFEELTDFALLQGDARPLLKFASQRRRDHQDPTRPSFLGHPVHAPEASLSLCHAEGNPALDHASPCQRLTLRITLRSVPFMFSIALVVEKVRQRVVGRLSRSTVSVLSRATAQGEDSAAANLREGLDDADDHLLCDMVRQRIRLPRRRDAG